MWLLISLCYIFSSTYVQGDCVEGCKQPTLFYNDLNCKPIFDSPGDCCPSHYNCPDTKEINDKKCRFHGKIYNIGDSLDDNEIYGNCKADCLCTEGYDGRAEFVCATLDCPEWLGYQANPGCYFTYEFDKCCSVGETCPPFNVTCKVSDKTFYEGEKFFPYDAKCTKCICRKGFKGKYEEPFCQKEACVVEINHQKDVKSFCAPSYLRLEDCCPYKWICPAVASDKVISAFKDAIKSSGPKCRFGQEELNIGDTFNRTSDNGGKVSCECRIPPYLTCIQNYEYE
ncbi:hypothetical protein ILUMI_16354 [Ignelater luminosus]|uniref:VWFC domain-containing protein n=1 Tax=Ignelater luminosus TaxID=2038154 RepID=A0A8K0CNR7_IGNLU|nr:hypothetical protein ILUMI_16354 [Ignelater luminosus]